MTILDPYTVVVSNDIELAAAITGVNTYNYIFFDQDITLTDGIIIPQSKSNLIIDGTYKEIRHTFTDMNSAAATNTLYINSLPTSAPTVHITMQNMDIIGRNYYGIVCVYDSSNAANTTTTYKNIKYTGCQITYNNFGITEYIDSNITINNTTSSRQGEVGEVHKVVIGGNTTINHTFSGFSAFHFRGGSDASFAVLPDSNVNIILARNLFAGDVNLASMNFGANSVCTITAPAGLSLNSAQRVRDVVVDNGATLNVFRTTASGSATLYVENSFTVNNGANVFFKTSVSSTDPHLYFYTTNAKFTIDNPASCIFHNSGSANFYFTGTTNVNFTSYQINQWNTAPSIGDINNMPTYQWIRKEKGLITFTGTATNTTTNISYNNLDPVADINLPAVSSLQLRTLRVLSLGYLPLLKVNRIISTATKVSGTSVTNATLKAEYKGETAYGAADGGGVFNIPLTNEFIVDEKVKVTTSNNNYLYNNDLVIIEEPGELLLYVVPDTMVFDASSGPIASGPCIFGRDISGWTIEVYDSRVYSSDWKLYATIERDMRCDLNSLPGSLIYKNNSTITSLSLTPTMVFQGEDNAGVTKITDVKWDANLGILLKVEQEPLYVGKTYTTDITWILEE